MITGMPRVQEIDGMGEACSTGPVGAARSRKPRVAHRPPAAAAQGRRPPWRARPCLLLSPRLQLHLPLLPSRLQLRLPPELQDLPIAGVVLSPRLKLHLPQELVPDAAHLA